MNNFTLFHNHSYYSILDGLQSPKDIVSRAVELGMKTVGISDHGSLSGIIKFYRACKEKNIKPMIGCEFYLGNEVEGERSNNHIIIIAKNYNGYKDLIKLNNFAAKNFYFKPRLTFDKIAEVAKNKNIIACGACIIGRVSTELFTNYKEAFSQIDEENCRKFLKDNWLEAGCLEANRWKSIFGDDFYLEAMIEGHPAQVVVLSCFREISKQTGIPLCASCDSHFSRPEDAIAHEVMICTQTKTTLAERANRKASGEDILFSDNSQYYMHSYEEMFEKFAQEEINNTFLMSEKVENYEIELGSPKIPQIVVPEKYTNVDEYVYDLCLIKLKELKKHKDKEYIDRLNFEYETFKNAKVSGTTLNAYFALLLDIVDFVKKAGSIPGVGRGSAAGSLVSYLLGITRIDPIETQLSFQRFFNTGRLSEGHISLPDVDLDVSADIKDDVIKHLKEKWGDNKVLPISTFGELKPKSAIKDTFRVCGVPFEQSNVLTKMFPDQEIKHDDDTENTIQGALDISEEFRTAFEPYKKEIELAKAIEGTVRNKGIHAAGVLISSTDVDEYLPLEWDAKSKSLVCAFDMKDSECFCVKIDILGLKLLSVFDIVQREINRRKIKPLKYIPKKDVLYYPKESITGEIVEETLIDEIQDVPVNFIQEKKMEFSSECFVDFLSKFKHEKLDIIKKKDCEYVKFANAKGTTCSLILDDIYKLFDYGEHTRTPEVIKYLTVVSYIKYYMDDGADYNIIALIKETGDIYKINPKEIGKPKTDIMNHAVKYGKFENGKITLGSK
jgi:DNA polymerase-3 subunit alpha